MSTISSNTRVFVIDDDLGICQSLRWLLESLHLNVITFTCPLDFLENFDTLKINLGCIISDVCMPNMSGLELLDQLNLRKNKLPVFMISGHSDIPVAVRAIKAGAIDFIPKPFKDLKFIDDIQQAILKSMSFESMESLLTPREMEILELIVAGNLNKQIAHKLNRSISTIEIHRSHIMQKLQAKNLPELVKNYMAILEKKKQ